jgi:hypothetical protein
MGVLWEGTLWKRKIKELMTLNWKVRVTHVYPKANKCSDVYTNLDSEGDSGATYLENPPSRMFVLLSDDCSGV